MQAPTQRFQAIVIGVGGMGSATCYYLARRGVRVLGLERFDVPHTMGSSHGYTRIIRLAYLEHPSYVGLLRRSYELWREIEAHVGERLLHITGSLDIGPADGIVFRGSLQSCIEHELEHEVLTGSELSRRFPGYQFPGDYLSVLQPEGGFLAPERCIVNYVQAAQERGAEIHGREQVLDWQPISNGVRVRTDRGVYEADRLVITAGAWADRFLPFLRGLAVPERQVLGWFQPVRTDRFQPSCFPVFNAQSHELGRYYGFPIHGVPGFKIGKYHHFSENIDPETFDHQIDARDEQALREFTMRYFPEANGPIMSMATCMFTNTPDRHFVIDAHPECPQVVFASACSGHGFKFASVVGEIMADLAQRGSSRHDISFFRLDRLRGPGAPVAPAGHGRAVGHMAPPARRAPAIDPITPFW